MIKFERKYVPRQYIYYLPSPHTLPSTNTMFFLRDCSQRAEGYSLEVITCILLLAFCFSDQKTYDIFLTIYLKSWIQVRPYKR
jgi:hypothetical protein